MNKRRVLVVGGTGYLGQHLLQSFADDSGPSCSLALAFTHHSVSPPRALLDAIPQALPFHVDLRNGNGLDAICHAFGQVSVSKLRSDLPVFYATNMVWLNISNGSVFTLW